MTHRIDLSTATPRPAAPATAPALGLLLAATFALPAFAQQPAPDTLTAAQVRAGLEAQGYTRVHDVEFEDGVWTADARSADGKRVEVRVDPRTGKVYPDDQVARLGEADVRARLATAGYTNVHDVDYKDGLWTAEADDPAGRDVELKIDPATGAVIGSERD